MHARAAPWLKLVIDRALSEDSSTLAVLNQVRCSDVALAFAMQSRRSPTTIQTKQVRADAHRHAASLSDASDLSDHVPVMLSLMPTRSDKQTLRSGAVPRWCLPSHKFYQTAGKHHNTAQMRPEQWRWHCYLPRSSKGSRQQAVRWRMVHTRCSDGWCRGQLHWILEAISSPSVS